MVHDKRVVIFFGEMGAGKTYQAKQYALENGFTFYEGDDCIHPEMMNRVKHFLPVSKTMLQDYTSYLLFEILNIAETMDTQTLVVAQALYLDEERKFLAKFLEASGYDVEFVWVRVSIWRNIKQLLSRKRGFRWFAYWLFSKPWFELPTHMFSFFK